MCYTTQVREGNHGAYSWHMYSWQVQVKYVIHLHLHLYIGACSTVAQLHSSTVAQLCLQTYSWYSWELLPRMTSERIPYQASSVRRARVKLSVWAVAPGSD